MILLLILLLTLVWLAIGAWSFVHWWTTQFDFTRADIPWVCLLALLGPLAYPVGWTLHHSNARKPIVPVSRDDRP